MGMMRVLFAVAVLSWHAPEGLLPRILHPAMAVQCFYLISGFYVQLLIFERFRDPVSDFKFYRSRLLRIFPLYLVVLPIEMLWWGAENYQKVFGEGFWFTVLFFANNLLILGQDVLRFFPYGADDHTFSFVGALTPTPKKLVPLTVMGQSWTLAIEFYFYLLAPFLLRRSTWIIILLATLSVGTRLAIGNWGYHEHGWLYEFFPNELALFLTGAMGFRFFDFCLRPLSTSPKWCKPILTFCGAVFIFYVWYLFFGQNFVSNSGYGLAPTGVSRRYWSVVVGTAIVIPFAFLLFKGSKIDRFLGEFSYPIYLFHFAIINALLSFLDVSKVRFVGISTLVLTTALAWLAIRYIEIPMRAKRNA